MASTTNQTAAYTQFLDVINGQSQGEDYLYDPNGNLTYDINKGIADIDYNHLNKPTKVEYSCSSGLPKNKMLSRISWLVCRPEA